MSRKRGGGRDYLGFLLLSLSASTTPRGVSGCLRNPRRLLSVILVFASNSASLASSSCTAPLTRRSTSPDVLRSSNMSALFPANALRLDLLFSP